MRNPKEELLEYIEYLEEEYSKIEGTEPDLRAHYLYLIKQLTLKYANMISMEHEFDTLGYVLSDNKNLDREIQEEIKYIVSSIKVNLKEDFGHVIWQSEFCRKCEESIFCDTLKTTSKYQNEFQKAKKGFLNEMEIIDFKPSIDKLREIVEDKDGYLEALFTKCGAKTPNKNWIYLNLWLPMFPNWHIINQTEYLSLYTMDEIVKEMCI